MASDPEKKESTRKNFPLRISPDLYVALERWASDELRSVNAQIEFLLTDAVKKAGRLSRGDESRSAQAVKRPHGRYSDQEDAGRAKRSSGEEE